tara:strand:+ start:3355 stop:4161 length:807 start_codon:yes stop_codon:yes gene_type:complete
MKFNKIVAFGDSWTAGEGFDYELERSMERHTFSDEEWEQVPKDYFGGNKTLFDARSNHSYTKYLADLYNVPFEVYGASGGSNESIMNNFFRFRGGIDDKTLVIFMWSSKFRDRLLFLPKLYTEDTRWLVWSKDLLKNEANRFWKDVPNEWEEKWREYFYVKLFDEKMYDTYTAMYKCSIQHFMEYHKIPYMMCNAFEPAEPHEHVSKEFYYKYDSTLYDDIKDMPGDIWEGNPNTPPPTEYLNGLHPNAEGYKLIANKLKKFVDDKFI